MNHAPERRFALRRQQLIPRPSHEVFPFFQDLSNLELLTPRWLGFRIVRRPVEPLAEGSRIEYRLRLFGVPLRWHTVIERFDPGWGFVDVQERGPYREWVHCHLFAAAPVSAGGTPPADSDPTAAERTVPGVLMEDRVDYRLPFGRLGLLAAPFVRLQLTAIFAHRGQEVRRRFRP